MFILIRNIKIVQNIIVQIKMSSYQIDFRKL